MRVVHTMPWRKFKNVRVHAPCHSTVAQICLYFTCWRKWHDNFVVTSRDTLEIFLNISKFSPRHGTHYFTWPACHAHCHEFFPHCRAKLRAMWRKSFVVPVWGLLYLFIMQIIHEVQTRGQSNLTKSASRGAHSPVRGHPRRSKVVPLNSWGRSSY